MGQKILVALDDSMNAMRTIAFITQTFSPSENDITLFSVLPDIFFLSIAISVSLKSERNRWSMKP